MIYDNDDNGRGGYGVDDANNIISHFPNIYLTIIYFEMWIKEI